METGRDRLRQGGKETEKDVRGLSGLQERQVTGTGKRGSEVVRNAVLSYLHNNTWKNISDCNVLRKE